MVRILSTGEIVPDNDPRAGSSQPGNQQHNSQRFQQHVNTDQNEMQQRAGGSVSIFDSFNQRLSEAGVPTWHMGPYRVEPIVSVGFIVVFLLMGFRGIIFGLILFLVVKWSSSETQGGAFQNFMAQGQNFLRGGGGGQRAPTSSQQSERQQRRSNRRSDSTWGGTGQRLGNT